MTVEIKPALGDLLQDIWRDNFQNFLGDGTAEGVQDASLQDTEIREENSEPTSWASWLGRNRTESSKDEADATFDTFAATEVVAGPKAANSQSEDVADMYIQDAEEPVLVENAKADPQAFGLLYERYLDRIYAYIYRRVGNRQDTEDLTARTFYKALNKLNSYEDRGYPFSAWLFRIAHNSVANWHRDGSRRHFLSIDRLWSYSQDAETPEEQVEREENHSALWDAINRLPKERRDLLIYKFSNCLSNVEIGELMNKSESAIKSLYWRTLAALRQDLEQDLEQSSYS